MTYEITAITRHETRCGVGRIVSLGFVEKPLKEDVLRAIAVGRNLTDVSCRPATAPSKYPAI